MYKKLLSNLPFNPSLISNVSFYAKRLHKEEKLRRLGVLSIVLAVLIQMSAVVSPPEPSLAESGNDIIRGGFTSRDQAVNYCRTNTQDFATILNYYRVTCDILASATTHEIPSTSFSMKLDSMGRFSQGPTITSTGKPTNEYPVSIAGTTYYMRNLWAWDSGSYSNYQVLNMKNLDGEIVMIMFSCGNIITIDPYTPPDNSKPPIENPPVADDICPNKPGIQTAITQCDVCPNISGVQYSLSDCDVCPNKPGSQTKPAQCDICPNKPGTQTRYLECDVCPNLSGVQYELNQCDVCPNKPGTQTTVSECDVCPNIAGVQYYLSQCDVCPNVPGIQGNRNDCYPCPEAQTDNSNTVCLELNKSASNQTRNINNADGTTAYAGDTIVYTLSVENKGTQTVKDFIIEENMSDVLQYSDIVGLDGGKKEENDTVRWEKVEIKAKKTITKKITVKVKNPIPQTPVSASDPSAFDLVMTNVYYGNAVNIKLPPSVVKRTELIVSSLPNTGPTSSAVVGIIVTVMVSYFFARVRLLAKETDLVKQNYISGEV